MTSIEQLIEHRAHLKRMLGAARGMPSSPARNAVIERLETETLYIKLWLNTAHTDMIPTLPSNPMTITPQVHGRHLTADGVYHKYAGRELTKELFDEVRRDLRDIRAADDYERCTNEIREGAKRILRRILDQEQ